MAHNPLSPSKIAIAAVAALVMLLVAIIVRNFWLSLILGVLGAATFVLAAVMLREYRRRLPDEDKQAH